MGLIIALVIITLWSGHLVWSLLAAPLEDLPGLQWVAVVVHVLLQGYLSTGLFITAHDAIHGTVSRSRAVNTAVGTLAAFLFAGLSYRRLSINHHRHHAHPAEDHNDPDYHPSNSYFRWFVAFMRHYASWSQFIIMGVAFNVLKLWIAEPRLWVYWILPAFIGAFQLFTIGTYLPHRKPHTHDMPHNARSMRLNHLLAMVSCYFFGYHTEHHLSPGTPWWKLWKVKEERQGAEHRVRSRELS